MKNFMEWLEENDLIEEKERETVNGEEQYGWDEIFRECYDTKFHGKDGKVVTVNEEDVEGGEGQGDGYFIVYSVDDGETKTFYRLDGWYASHHGADFDDNTDLYEVVKKPVTYQEWKRV